MIEPAEIDRDELGYWWHPALPEDVEEDFDLEAYVQEQGMETLLIRLDSDDTNPVWITYDEGVPDVSAWEPTPPEGEGWFLLAIFDTEIGPSAY